MEERYEDGGICLAVTGELDLATAPAFAERATRLSASASRVRLDLSHVDFMDGTGLDALLSTITGARQAHREIEVRSELTPQVKRLIEITQVEHVLRAPKPARDYASVSGLAHPNTA